MRVLLGLFAVFFLAAAVASADDPAAPPSGSEESAAQDNDNGDNGGLPLAAEDVNGRQCPPNASAKTVNAGCQTYDLPGCANCADLRGPDSAWCIYCTHVGWKNCKGCAESDRPAQKRCNRCASGWFPTEEGKCLRCPVGCLDCIDDNSCSCCDEASGFKANSKGECYAADMHLSYGKCCENTYVAAKSKIVSGCSPGAPGTTCAFCWQEEQKHPVCKRFTDDNNKLCCWHLHSNLWTGYTYDFPECPNGYNQRFCDGCWVSETGQASCLGLN